MDKARDVKRRGASRFKHSKPKLSSGHVNGVREARREKKLRKLSSVVGKKSSSSHEDWEMDSLGTLRDEDELPSVGRDANSSIRFKLSEKFFDDCNGVGHASVPRRLRSAMNKRSCDAISPRSSDSKKLKNHLSVGIISTKADVVKKSKLNVKQGGSHRFSRRIISGPITKDEEEVAETLYALAGMFPKNDTSDDCEGKYESLEPNPSGVPESNNSNPVAVEERNGSSPSPLIAAEDDVPSSSAEILPETVKVESSTELYLSDTKKLHLLPDDSIPLINQKTSSLYAKTETPSGSVVKFSIPTELHLNDGLKQAEESEVPILERRPGTALGMVTPIGSQMEPANKVEESKKTGLALWPGLPSTSISRGARVNYPNLPSSTSKLPAWLNVACLNSTNSSVQYNSFSKVSTADKKLSKRSATHVYISRLIQTLKMSENKDTTTVSQRPYEELNQGASPAIRNFNGEVNGVNEVVSTSSTENAVAKQIPNGAKNVVLQPKLHHDHLQPGVASAAVSNWQKQSFDFFMSITRGSGMEVNDGSNRARNGLEQLSPHQNPYLPTFVQNQFGMTYSLPQQCYNPPSSSCSDQFSLSQQVQMQLPSYGIPLYSAQTTPTTALMKHQHQHQQQQQQRNHQHQQRLWGVSYRTDDSPKTTIQFLNLPNKAPSQGPQQQLPMPVAPSQFSARKVKRQEHHLPSVYEEHGGRFRTSALPLQLLCNERL